MRPAFWGGLRRETGEGGGVDYKGPEETLDTVVMDVYCLDCGDAFIGHMYVKTIILYTLHMWVCCILNMLQQTVQKRGEIICRGDFFPESHSDYEKNAIIFLLVFFFL